MRITRKVASGTPSSLHPPGHAPHGHRGKRPPAGPPDWHRWPRPGPGGLSGGRGRRPRRRGTQAPRPRGRRPRSPRRPSAHRPGGTGLASTLGDTIRFDPRPHDEGNALIRDLIDATVCSISAAPELQRLTTVRATSRSPCQAVQRPLLLRGWAAVTGQGSPRRRGGSTECASGSGSSFIQRGETGTVITLESPALAGGHPDLPDGGHGGGSATPWSVIEFALQRAAAVSRSPNFRAW